MILLNKAKNYIINGAMDYWQRNSTFTNPSSGTYFADRFLVSKASSASMNIARDTDVPTLEQSKFVFPYSSLFTVTASSAMANNQYHGFLQRIEGQIFAPLANRKMTLSFWVKSSVVGVYPVAFSNGTDTRSYVTTVTINNANTYEKKTVTLEHDSSGTWNYTAGIGLQVKFILGSGSDFNTPLLNSWQNGNYFSHSSCTNLLATNGATFRITGIQLEEGIEPSNFERAGGLVDNELRLCQRYFEKSYDLNTPPAAITEVGCLGNTGVTSSIRMFATFKATKRVNPSMVVYNTGTGATSSMRSESNNNGTAVAARIGVNGFAVTDSNANASQVYTVQWTADAEL